MYITYFVFTYLLFWIILLVIPYVTEKFNPRYKQVCKDMTIDLIPMVLSFLKKETTVNYNLFEKIVFWIILLPIVLLTLVVLVVFNPLILFILLMRTNKRKEKEEKQSEVIEQYKEWQYNKNKFLNSSQLKTLRFRENTFFQPDPREVIFLEDKSNTIINDFIANNYQEII